MKQILFEKLLEIAKLKLPNDDPSHDINHALRVLSTARKICRSEKGDIDIIIPAALFHDLVNHPKNSPKAAFSADESADKTNIILQSLPEYPQSKIPKVISAIRSCSFSKGVVPNFLEAKILQDADGLEATGAISIMRTFASSGSMKRPFYNTEDPFCLKRSPDDLSYALDLFYTRLLKVEQRMHTMCAKRIASRRTLFLKHFLSEFEKELNGK